VYFKLLTNNSTNTNESVMDILMTKKLSITVNSPQDISKYTKLLLNLNGTTEACSGVHGKHKSNKNQH